MAKTYNIVENLGTQFTYQLYANMSGTSSGSSNVTCTATAEEPETFFMSFTVSGQTLPSSPNSVASATGDVSDGVDTLLTLFFRLSTFPLPSQEKTIQVYSNAFTQVLVYGTDTNADYEITFNSTKFFVYRNGVLLGDCNRQYPDKDFATTLTPVYFANGGGVAGTFSSVVFGS